MKTFPPIISDLEKSCSCIITRVPVFLTQGTHSPDSARPVWNHALHCRDPRPLRPWGGVRGLCAHPKGPHCGAEFIEVFSTFCWQSTLFLVTLPSWTALLSLISCWLRNQITELISIISEISLFLEQYNELQLMRTSILIYLGSQTGSKQAEFVKSGPSDQTSGLWRPSRYQELIWDIGYLS